MTRLDWWRAKRHFAKQDQGTIKGYERLEAQWAQSKFCEYSSQDFAYQVMATAMADVCEHPMGNFEGSRFDHQLRETIAEICEAEGLLTVMDIKPATFQDKEKLPSIRRYVQSKEKQLEDPLDTLSCAMNALATIIGRIFNKLPHGVIELLNSGDEWDEDNLFEIDALDMLHRPKELLSEVGGIFQQTGCLDLDIFVDEYENHLVKTYRHSKMEAYRDPEGNIRVERETAKKRLILPFDFKGTADECLKTYFAGGFVPKLFKFRTPFTIPETKRFEHTHIVGKTGHGKTQLLQKMILKDLYPAIAGRASVVVIDSQGDMIKKIAQLKIFDPDFENNVSDRLVIIDPTDPQKPPALNLFDFSLAGIEASPKEQERLLNASIELYEYMFGTLLGAEMTQKQGVIFKNLARLMTVVPEATVQTLLNFLEEGDTSINHHINKLSGVPRRFFDSQYNDQQFKETKKQILWRLFDIFGQAGFERMFVNKKNAIDLYGSINSGKIILINTASDYLGDHGSKIFGRFFIALLSQAVARRATLHESDRLPTYVYIDEASEYFDDKIRTLVNKARKQKIALTMAHQELKQLTPELLNTMRTTGTKIVGRVTQPDAKDMAREMNCDKEQLQNVCKVDYKYAEYSAYVGDLTETAVKMRVPFGALESQVKMDARSLYTLLETKKDELMGSPVIAETLGSLNSSARETSDPLQKHVRPPKPIDLEKCSEMSDGLFDDDFGSPEML